MSICAPINGSWSATSPLRARLLAPVTDSVDTTGVSVAALAAGATGFGSGAGQAAMAPQTHKYTNRPGSPPRGRLR